LLDVILVDTSGAVIPLNISVPASIDLKSGKIGGGNPSNPGGTNNPGGTTGGTIGGSSELTILSPTATQTVPPGSVFEIKWNALDKIKSVDLFYSADGGATWQTIAKNRNNTGTYRWAVPNVSIPKCIMRIYGYDVAGYKYIGTSSESFTVKSSSRPAGCK
jgi:hypothetical protein